MTYQPKHRLAEAVRRLSWKARIGAVAGVVTLGLGGSAAALAATSSTSGIPTQGVRTGANVADFCFSFGSNVVHNYDWNQAPCPSGTYPLSFVSAPQDFTLTINGQQTACKLTATTASGNESDAITCASQPPLVNTSSAVVTGSGSAILTGTVNPNGSDTGCDFVYDVATDYSATSGFGSSARTTSSVDEGNGSAAKTVAVDVTGLSSNTPYAFELYCSNSASSKSVPGGVGTFTTAAAG